LFGIRDVATDGLLLLDGHDTVRVVVLRPVGIMPGVSGERNAAVEPARSEEAGDEPGPDEQRARGGEQQGGDEDSKGDA
jgi:hypothetical protein